MYPPERSPCARNTDHTFAITVTDDNPQPSAFDLQNGDSQLVTFSGPSTYTVSEPPSSIFSVTFSGDCKATSPGSTEATGTISAGEHQTCTITNQEKP
jgi:hypothetical protein